MTTVQQVKCFSKKGLYKVQLHVIHVTSFTGFLLNEEISILTHDMPCKVCPALQGHQL